MPEMAAPTATAIERRLRLVLDNRFLSQSLAAGGPPPRPDRPCVVLHRYPILQAIPAA
jgi:hypothetical protein